MRALLYMVLILAGSLLNACSSPYLYSNYEHQYRITLDFPLENSAFTWTEDDLIYQDNVRSVILDRKGEALIGATVQLSNTNSTAVSSADIDGRGSLFSEAGVYDLEISYAGYLPIQQTFEIRPGKAYMFNVQLGQDWSLSPILINSIRELEDYELQRIINCLHEHRNDIQQCAGKDYRISLEI